MEGYDWMNSGKDFLINGLSNESFQGQWQQQLAEWRQLLARCGKKPSRRRVHGLRVATLRIQALLGFWWPMHEQHPAARAVKRWNKQADRLRHTLQDARSAEVYLGKLEQLRGEVAARSEVQRVCLRQIARLKRRFVRQREAADKEVVEEIGNRRARLELWSRKIECSIDEPVAREGTSGEAAVRERVAGLAAEFPALSADCLHAYRKRVKNLRYLAEFFAVSDSAAAQQAKALGRMQTLIGEWRDWQLLGQEADRHIKGGDKALSDLLAALEAKSLRRALRFCQRAQERLLQGGAMERIPRKPVQSIRVESEWNEKQGV
jgi:CHAD domain-containing protein